MAIKDRVEPHWVTIESRDPLYISWVLERLNKTDLYTRDNIDRFLYIEKLSCGHIWIYNHALTEPETTKRRCIFCESEWRKSHPAKTGAKVKFTEDIRLEICRLSKVGFQPNQIANLLKDKQLGLRTIYRVLHDAGLSKPWKKIGAKNGQSNSDNHTSIES